MLLSADDILKADDLETREVEVPEWGGTVRVRALSGIEREKWEAGVWKTHRGEQVLDRLGMRAKLVVRCLVDADGAQLFPESDAGKLGRKSSKVIEQLFEVVAEMSGLGENAVEELARNFGETPDDDSSSGSPESSVTPSAGYSPGSPPAN